MTASSAGAIECDRVLVVHHRRGVERIRLTGDAKLDELLRRFAARGGGFMIEMTAREEE